MWSGKESKILVHGSCVEDLLGVPSTVLGAYITATIKNLFLPGHSSSGRQAINNMHRIKQIM